MGKLQALRRAARLGFGALDRGEFRECDNSGDLERYLCDLSEEVISKSAK
jgi:antitoxin ParD1/3/4